MSGKFEISVSYAFSCGHERRERCYHIKEIRSWREYLKDCLILNQFWRILPSGKDPRVYYHLGTVVATATQITGHSVYYSTENLEGRGIYRLSPGQVDTLRDAPKRALSNDGEN